MSDQESPKRLAARKRRSEGVVSDFDGRRLSLARRLARKQRTVLARDANVTPAAISQFEKDQARPTLPVLAQLSLALGQPIEFFRRGRPIADVPGSAAHFRSLRSTPALTRDQALAFAELALAVIDVFEQYVEFPSVNLPDFGELDQPSDSAIAQMADQTRRAMDIPHGPIGHVVRHMEANGVIALRLPRHIDRGVDAFSTFSSHRPLVLMSTLKNDRARSRFDASHELGHLVMHRDVPPGSKVVEADANTFASYLLLPEGEIEPELPRRLDWEAMQHAKKRWGVSLRALAYRAHRVGIWTDSTYRRANQMLASMGLPEPGPLGPPESPSILGNSVSLLEQHGTQLGELVHSAGFSLDQFRLIVDSGSDQGLRMKVVVSTENK
ncbi:XRE family transcriptional regulator [Rhodococcus sp. IEGM 1330]|uniref:helix-turn-helix domain-containing protein n=1 Tax=Rhodococcus sp. IEGM 1330 TaxID=3082225 RepID=UPI0029536278|nr:XRE family transcriptional regulator [Rhodococcus sp. IEGM 1330]MDV8025338.1 XRE family transcriptional regulator [Rhodococcus sp. IEGM 1330]